MVDASRDKIVYLVRHGQSVHNIAPVFQSDDAELSEEGREQAKLLGERAKHLRFETLLASPFKRAKQTAEIIGKATGKEPEFNELFEEARRPDSLQGKLHKDKQAQKAWKAWGDSLRGSGKKIEGAENYNDVVNRAKEALEFLKNREESSMLVVTHGYFLRVVVAVIMLADKLDIEGFKNIHRATAVENTGLTVLQYKDAFEDEHRWRLWIFNDHAHLAE